MISVTQANTEPWISIWRDGQAKTWMKKYSSIVKIVNYKSKTPPNYLVLFDKYHEKFRYHPKIGRYISVFDKIFGLVIPKEIPTYTFNKSKNLLEVNSMSMYILTNRRNLSLYKYFIDETNCDFLFQTNTSSYINCEILLDILKNYKANLNLYAGHIIEQNSNREFVSGAGRLMSRATIELILENHKSYPHDNLEDVSVGDFLRKYGIKPIALQRLDIPNLEALNRISDLELNKNFIFRCKSDTIPRIDAQIMLKLHGRLN